MANETQSRTRAKKARMLTVKDYLNGYEQELVDARELHKRLGVGRAFSHWIEERIRQCELVEKVDYIRAPHMMTICSMGIDYRLSAMSALQITLMQRLPKTQRETASA